MYLSLRSFKKALNDVIQSRRAIANMNSLYPNATAQDLQDTDNVCIICREEMVGVANGQPQPASGSLAKKLPCGHIFHVSCLRSWFQRQQTCPTCRHDVLRPTSTTRIADGVRQALDRRNNPNVAGPNLGANPDRQQMMMNQMFMANFLMNQMNQRVNNQQPPAPAAPQPPPTPSEVPPASQAPSVSPNTSLPTPSFIPAFVPAGAPFMMPPPVMPVAPQDLDLSNLSDEDLLRLIRRDREGLEGRLKLYSQSKTLMDAAINNLLLFNSLIAAGSSSQPAFNGPVPQDELTRGVSIPSELLAEDGSVASSSKTTSISDVRRVRLSKFSAEGAENSAEDNKSSEETKKEA